MEEPIIGEEQLTQLSLYELNRRFIEQMGPMKSEEIEEAKEVLANWIQNTPSDYYLLYGKEMSYFTLFHSSDDYTKVEFNNLVDAVMACLNNVGKLYCIDIAEDANAIEIWVKWSDNDIVTCMYLFDYSEGIVYVQK